MLGAIVFWGLICWALLYKAGYRGSFLWLMLFLMLLTPVGIILFALLPWAIARKLDNTIAILKTTINKNPIELFI